MYKLITLSNHRLAQAFVDYMATKHISIQLNRVGNDVELWLYDETKYKQVKDELALFIKNPMDAHYWQASWQTGKLNVGITYPSTSILSTLYRDSGRLTLFMMSLSLIIFFIMQFNDGYQTILTWLMFPADPYQYWQLWRWITPILLHFSISHILFNLIVWWFLGNKIEHYLGMSKLLEITLLSAGISNYAESFFSGNQFGGISGVVYALAGYSWVYGEYYRDQPVNIDRSVIVMMIVWIGLGYANIIHNISNTAHLSGFLVGLALASCNTFIWPNKVNK